MDIFGLIRTVSSLMPPPLKKFDRLNYSHTVEGSAHSDAPRARVKEDALHLLVCNPATGGAARDLERFNSGNFRDLSCVRDRRDRLRVFRWWGCLPVKTPS